jgi:hypothetical protein
VRLVTCDQTFGKDEPSPYPHWPAFNEKCRKEGLTPAAIAAFRYNYEKLASGANLMIPEKSITPVGKLPSYDSLTAEDSALLGQCVMLKLNGGLGTGMGLEKAKSLLKLKGDDTFLDFIAKQVLHMRSSFGVPLAFMLMNSFSSTHSHSSGAARDPLSLSLEEQDALSPAPTTRAPGSLTATQPRPTPSARSRSTRPSHLPASASSSSRTRRPRWTRPTCRPPTGRRAALTSGARPATGTSTRPCLAAAPWTSCWPKASSERYLRTRHADGMQRASRGRHVDMRQWSLAS